MSATEQLAAERAIIIAEAAERYEAELRRARRIPAARKAERVAAMEAADARYAEACREARLLDPITPEFRTAHPEFNRTGEL